MGACREPAQRAGRRVHTHRFSTLARVAGVVGLSVVSLVAVSTVSNLIMGAVERANVDQYGETVSIDGGEVTVSVAGNGDQTMVLLSGYGTASAAPVGVYSEREIEQIRLMTIWNYANPAMIDENNRSAENFEQQLESLDRSELVVLDGGHYLHWMHSEEMAEPEIHLRT